MRGAVLGGLQPARAVPATSDYTAAPLMEPMPKATVQHVATKKRSNSASPRCRIACCNRSPSDAGVGTYAGDREQTSCNMPAPGCPS
eukprot:jgi/Tetstr1/465113/TSEL_000846.t1